MCKPHLLILGCGGAFPLEHFALMKRCHVSSDRDGLREHNLLRDLWHGSAWWGGGERLQPPVWEKEARLPEKKAQRCDWCRWTTTSRQSSIWISRWKLQYQQFADGIWTSEHDNISVSVTECVVVLQGAWLSGKLHFCEELYCCFCQFGCYI